MQRVIDRIQNGCNVLGWEGDERLAVYRLDTPAGPVHELWRLEDDNEMRRVVATEPGDPFDDTIIVWLCENDKRRKPINWDLAVEIDAANDKRQAKLDAERSEWVREDIGPRLHDAFRKDEGW